MYNTIEDFEKGDIVFWAAKNATSKWRVKFGVIDFLSDCGAIIDLLSVREHRFVNGVPINEFKSETKFKKLPKGWSWNTELFEMTYEEIEVPEELNDLRKADNIETLLAMGYLVPMKEVFDGVIEAEITKEGYRIIKNYPMWRRQVPKSATVPYHKLYNSYGLALEEVNKLNAEIERQATLTDEEWSIEEISKTIARYQSLYGMTDTEAEKIVKFFASNKKVADIETRISSGELQWKYWKNKKWHVINAEDL